MSPARLSLALLLSINLINYIDRYVLFAVEPLVRDALLPAGTRDPDAKMGLLASAFLITYMLAAPLFGWLADRLRRWLIIAAGVLIWSLATGASGLATTFTMLLLTRVFVGIGEAAWGPVAPTIIADMYPLEKRGTVLAWFNTALAVGPALGFALGGLIAHTLNGALGIPGWRWAFFLVVPPGLLCGTLALFRKDPPRTLTATRRITLADAAALFRIPSYLYNNLGMTAMTFVIGGMSAWMPRYIHIERLRHDPADTDGLKSVGLTFGAILLITGLAGTLSGGYLGDWLRPRLKHGGAYLTLSGATMLLAFPMFLLVLITPAPYFWVFIALTLYLIFINTGPTNTVIANVTPSPIRATAYALNILIIHALGDAISPPVIGAISDHFPDPILFRDFKGLSVGFAAVSILLVVSGVCWLLGAKHLRRDTVAANPAAP